MVDVMPAASKSYTVVMSPAVRRTWMAVDWVGK